MEHILYLIYLVSWKQTHRGKAFKGCKPVCFNEWHDCELQEMIRHPEWYKPCWYGFIVNSIRERRTRKF